MEAPPLPLSARAQRLTAFVRDIAGSAGIEHSVKASPRGMETERFLLTWAAHDSRNDALPELLRELGIRADDLAAITGALSNAAFFHLGYEGGPRERIKFYCERQVGAVAAPALGPLYTAWKWKPGNPAAIAVDEYHLSDVTSLEAARTLIASSFGRQEGEGGELETGFMELLRIYSECREIPLFLEVRRRAGIRSSFDTRCYESGLRVGYVERLMRGVDREFQCNGAFLAHLEPQCGAELGHVAGGLGEDGLPFVTIYFGARTLA